MEMIVAYLVGVVVMTSLFAVRAPHEELRVVLALSVFWPISIVLIAGMILLSAVGWDLDVAESNKMFGFRKPTNTKVRGFAITVFGTEIQFYSMKKD